VSAAAHVASILAHRGVTVLTEQLVEGMDKAVTNVFADAGEARTSTGQIIAFDLALWCIGGRPNTAYMQRHFSDTLTPGGRIKVGPDLRVVGQDTVFALGDITDLPENKMAFHIQGHVKTAERNVRALLAGEAPPLTYKPQTGNPTMVITLGSRTGVGHLHPFGVIRWPWFIRKAKAEHMLVPKYRKAIGN
jgi:apoptosis-inducing factor 2